MARRSRIALVGCALAALLVIAAPAAAEQARLVGEKQVKDRVVDLTIATSAFAAPTTVEVMLPVGYDADPARRWPVTYVTAGTMNRYYSFRTVVGGDKLTAGYPSIIVSPDGNSGYWSDWYNGGAFGPPRYETFVIDQLIPLIDARYRTIPDRAHRLITGVSMGGYGAVMYAARHPDLFAAVGSISGADDSNLPPLATALSASSTFDGGPPDAIYGPRAEQEVRWRGHNPVDLASNLWSTDVQVRTANGVPAPEIGEKPASADTVSCVIEGGVHMGSVSLHDTLDALKIPHLWKDYGPGCHTAPNFKREIVDTLARFAELLAHPAAAPSSVDYRSIEPHFDVFGWHVDADPGRALEFLHLQAGRDVVTLSGSGRTTVTTPALYRGLAAVDVDGVPTAPGADGRLRFTVDLGAPDTGQQYAAGTTTTVRTRRVALAPHAVARITRVARRRHGVRVCVRSLGGDVPAARLKLGARGRRVHLRAASRCYRIAGRPSGRVTLRGTDTFGHPVRASAAVPRAKR